jgi:hypothetical protein
VDEVAGPRLAIEVGFPGRSLLTATVLAQPSQTDHLGQLLVAGKLLRAGGSAEDPLLVDGFALANRDWNGRVKTEELSRRRRFRSLPRAFAYHIY